MSIKAQDIANHWQHVADWVDWEHTCDGFKAGSPNTPITHIAVGWQSTMDALRQANDLGCELFITHEPTFYSHMDDNEAWKATPAAQEKMRFLQETGMVVYRCHDAWDTFPKIGVRDSWSAYLDLGEPVAQRGYYNLHDVPMTTAWELAGRIAEKVKPLRQQGVQFIGQKQHMVDKLAIGTGAITNAQEMVAMGADVVLLTDDGMVQWRDGAWLADTNIPAIVVNHTTAEFPGIRNLQVYLKETFDVPVELVGDSCGYEMWVTQPRLDVAVRMFRSSLNDLPEIQLPDGYHCADMQEDQVWAYIEVMNQSNFSGNCDQAWFERTFASDPLYRPEYIKIIWKGDKPVAAAAAWHTDSDEEPRGKLHWVGAINTARGLGLGKAITLAALYGHKARGFKQAILDTHTWRLNAIAAYMHMGFEPLPTETAPQEVWDQVLKDLETWRKRYAVMKGH